MKSRLVLLSFVLLAACDQASEEEDTHEENSDEATTSDASDENTGDSDEDTSGTTGSDDSAESGDTIGSDDSAESGDTTGSEPPMAIASISGYVTDLGGNSHPGTVIQFCGPVEGDDSGACSTVMLEDDAHFTLEVFSPGNYRFNAIHRPIESTAYANHFRSIPVADGDEIDLGQVSLIDIPALVDLANASGRSEHAIGDGLNLTFDPTTYNFAYEEPALGAARMPESAWPSKELPDGSEVFAIWGFYPFNSLPKDEDTHLPSEIRIEGIPDLDPGTEFSLYELDPGSGEARVVGKAGVDEVTGDIHSADGGLEVFNWLVLAESP